MVLLGIIASCNPVPSPIIVTPPNPQTKQSALGYENKSLEQILEEEISSVSVKVIIGDKQYFKDTYLDPRGESFKKYSKVIGIFLVNPIITKEYPSNFIFLNKDNKIAEQINTLYHELGHYNCYRTECPCLFSPVKIIAEYHAFKFQIEMALLSEREEIMREAICNILGLSLTEGADSAHGIAAGAITKKPLFLELITFYKNKAGLYNSTDFVNSLFPEEN